LILGHPAEEGKGIQTSVLWKNELTVENTQHHIHVSAGDHNFNSKRAQRHLRSGRTTARASRGTNVPGTGALRAVLGLACGPGPALASGLRHQPDSPRTRRDPWKCVVL